jgi:hypothetical protein
MVTVEEMEEGVSIERENTYVVKLNQVAYDVMLTALNKAQNMEETLEEDAIFYKRLSKLLTDARQ